jgi:hypothetical protein
MNTSNILRDSPLSIFAWLAAAIVLAPLVLLGAIALGATGEGATS